MLFRSLLDLGFRLPAAGGTDAMADFASLRGPVGMNRTYVAMQGDARDVAAWTAGLKAGRSFATNGPLLDLTLGGEPIGGTVTLKKAGRVPFHARLHSIVAVDHLALVCTGGVVTPLALSADHRSADVTGSIDVGRSGWCVLRADADRARDPILDLYPYATTSPVYLSVAGKPARSTAAADYFLAWLDRIAEGVARHPDWNTSEERATVEARIADARRSISARR